MSMSKGSIRERKRSKVLLIVEGKDEKEEFFKYIRDAFPTINIKDEDIWVYHTNIHSLYSKLMKYDDEIFSDIDVDLPFILSMDTEKEKQYKINYKDIYLIFDYDIQDNKFDYNHILKMQKLFNDSTDNGKLYINYPMLESYFHFKTSSDEEYMDLIVSNPKTVYSKNYKYQVSQYSEIHKYFNLKPKLKDYLVKTNVKMNEDFDEIIDSVLECTEEKELNKTLEELKIEEYCGELIAKNIKGYIKNKILKDSIHIESNISYFKLLNILFQKICLYNIKKAYKIQFDLETENMKEGYSKLNLIEILNKQNEVSNQEENSFLWVLNTSLFLISDYNSDLINWEIESK